VIEARMGSGRKDSGHSLSKHNLAKFSGHAHFQMIVRSNSRICAFTGSASSPRHANDIAQLIHLTGGGIR